MKHSKVELKWTANEAVLGDHDFVHRFLDFVVDGESLYKVFQKGEGGFGKGGQASPLGTFLHQSDEDDFVSRLLGEKAPDSWANQCCMYTCPLCGDMNCGAITVKVEIHDNQILWSSFAYEHPDYTRDINDEQIYEPIEPPMSFSFDSSHLREVLLGRPRRQIENKT